MKIVTRTYPLWVKLPKKVQFLSFFSFPEVKQLCEKTLTEQFVGGRPGYDKELLFFLLLQKKLTNWSFRTIAEMGGVSHSTFSVVLKRKYIDEIYNYFDRNWQGSLSLLKALR